MNFLFNLSEPRNPLEERMSALIGFALSVTLLAVACYFAFDSYIKHDEYFSPLFAFCAGAWLIPSVLFASLLGKRGRIRS